MARGWESKDVESQQELAADRDKARTALAPEELAKLAQRNRLELRRQRVLQEIQSACNPRFRQQLERELAHLDEALKRQA